jgi:hypothetical protein
MSDHHVPVFPGEIASTDLVEESHSSEQGRRDGTDVPQSADELLVITVLDAVDVVPHQRLVRWHPASTPRGKFGIDQVVSDLATVRTRVVSASIAPQQCAPTPKPPTVIVNERHQVISIPGSNHSAKRQLHAWLNWPSMTFWKRKK